MDTDNNLSRVKNRLNKLREKCLKNRPKSIMDDDYSDWKDLNDYNKKIIIMKYMKNKDNGLDKSERHSIEREDLSNYNFTNIKYDKVNRTIVSMKFSCK